MTDTVPPAKHPRKRLGGRRPPKTPEEAAQYAAWAMHRVATGRMTVDVCNALIALLKEYRSHCELAATLKRVRDLEGRLGITPKDSPIQP